jgi:hypothetical protein
MKQLFKMLCITCLLCAFGEISPAQYSLKLIQRFPENSAGKNNQVKFADVNGDGKKDMIASYTAPGTVGQVIGIWLNRGTKFSDSVDCTINLTFKNKACWFNVGDINGDGKADIVAISQYGGQHPPKVVYGRATFPKTITTADLNCKYPVDPDFQTMSQYTSIVIGDFNGDGYGDIVFPEQGTQISLGEYGGRMLMYYGGPSMTGDPDMVFHHPGNTEGYVMNPDTNQVFLRWFSPFISKGDFNGDGIDDIFTSGYYSFSNEELVSAVTGKKVRMDNTGAGVVYFGGADIDTIPDVIMVPPDEFLRFTTPTDQMYVGYCVYNAGDINRDGADEFSLPSWYWGINFVYKGIKGMPQVPSKYQTVVVRNPMFYFTKNRYNNMGYADQHGANLLPIGDVNGDGIPDLGNSRNYYGTGPDDIGVRLFFSKKLLAGSIDTSFVTADYSQIQESKMDFDGDGRADLVMNDLDGHLCLVKLEIVTSVNDRWTASAPQDFILEQNFPNPFNPSTVIQYFVPKASNVKLTVCNIVGQSVRTLVNEYQTMGAKEVTFNAATLPSGLYFYSLEAGGTKRSKIMTLIK